MTTLAPLRSLLACLSIASSGLAIAACSSASQARADFAQSYTCPPERVAVTSWPSAAQREHYSSVRAPTAQPSPPPDVAADPARLRMWQTEREAKRKQEEEVSSCDGYEVTGCGQQHFYCCDHSALPQPDGSVNNIAAHCHMAY